MRALDDAERLLVSGSFERAKSEAAAARQGAGSTSERVAAECVWIQAEYKLGGLTRHDLDAARMAAGFGEEFHRASALLWSRLRLANPADPAEAEAAAEKALQRIFERTLVDRRGGRRDEEGDDDAEILPGAAWLYAVHLTSRRRRRPRDARTWLAARVNDGTLTADASRRLDAEMDDDEANETGAARRTAGGNDDDDDDDDDAAVPAPARVKSRGRATKRREDGGSGGANGNAADDEQSRKPIDPDANPVDVDADVDADVFGMVAAVRSCARYLGVGDAHARGIGPAAAGAAVATAGVVAFAMASEAWRAWRRRRGGARAR